jgi:signal peptidase I
MCSLWSRKTVIEGVLQYSFISVTIFLMSKQWLSFLFEIIEVILVSTAIVLPIRFFLVQPFLVRGESMVPNYLQGDYLIIDELSYRFRNPERGEVVVFLFPLNKKEFYIKRIIGLPGETVQIKGGRVYINGTPLEERYLPTFIATNGDVTQKLGDDEYFVLGDNRGASYDSRRWGTLKRSYIVGRVWIRAWPLSRLAITSGQ